MTMIPTIHLNGTSKADLLEGHLNVLTALREAHDALCKAAPNGRDYYPQGSDAVNRATDEHRARLRKLHEIQKEIETITTAILEGSR